MIVSNITRSAFDLGVECYFNSYHNWYPFILAIL